MAPIWPSPNQPLLLPRSDKNTTGVMVAGIVAAALLAIGLAGHLIRDRVQRRKKAEETKRAGKGKEREHEDRVTLDQGEEEGAGEGREQKREEAADEKYGGRGIRALGKDSERENEEGKEKKTKKGLRILPLALPESGSRGGAVEVARVEGTTTSARDEEEEDRDDTAMEKKFGPSLHK